MPVRLNQRRRRSLLCLSCTFLLDELAGFDAPDEAAEQALRQILAAARALNAP